MGMGRVMYDGFSRKVRKNLISYGTSKIRPPRTNNAPLRKASRAMFKALIKEESTSTYRQSAKNDFPPNNLLGVFLIILSIGWAVYSISLSMN